MRPPVSGGGDASGLQSTVGASSITLGGLLKHLALVEATYFTWKLHGRDPGPPWPGPHRGRRGAGRRRPGPALP
ncbi:MAG: DinB family protein [Spirochaetaceae bacterium]|nr:DinB family protein [Spirochaetaceae bacterium]